MASLKVEPSTLLNVMLTIEKKEDEIIFEQDNIEDNVNDNTEDNTEDQAEDNAKILTETKVNIHNLTIFCI